MRRFQYSFAAVLVLLYSVQGTELCDFSDTKCLTKGAKIVYKNLVAGVRDLIKPIDPLYIEMITSDQETLKYEITNVYLSGLRKCEVALCEADKEKETYEYYLECPKLHLDFFYKAEGKFGPHEIDGNGLGSLKIDNYFIVLRGNYSTFFSEEDHLARLTVGLQEVETHLKGKLKFKTNYLLHPDKSKSDSIMAFIKHNYKEVEKIFRPQVLEKFMVIFVKAVDKYLQYFPLEEVIPKV